MLNLKSKPFIIIGPCAIESDEQMAVIIELVQKLKTSFVRAHIFKARTNPDSFQGIGVDGLSILKKIKDQNLKPVIEVCSKEQLNLVKDYASIIQIGARNMQNFELLKYIGEFCKDLPKDKAPFVMLKRGFANTLYEWLSSASYLEKYGVEPSKIILCERGTRNQSSTTGVTLDLQLALEAKDRTSYHVICDPSHGTKNAKYVLPMTKAIFSLDLDGILIEVHPNPKESVSDSSQALSVEEFSKFISDYL